MSLRSQSSWLAVILSLSMAFEPTLALAKPGEPSGQTLSEQAVLEQLIEQDDAMPEGASEEEDLPDAQADPADEQPSKEAGMEEEVSSDEQEAPQQVAQVAQSEEVPETSQPLDPSGDETPEGEGTEGEEGDEGEQKPDGWTTETIDEQEVTVYYQDGEVLKGIQTIDGIRYFLDETTGALHSSAGFVTTSDGNSYYTDKDGVIQTGWVTVSGKLYYLDPSTGIMKKSEIFKVDNSLYLSQADGSIAIKKGWVQTADNSRYYVSNANGVLSTGWLNLSGTWYYLYPSDGKMAVGPFKDGSTPYVANSNGACLANSWVKVGNDWYLTNAACDCRLGWAKVDGAWYYLDPAQNGKMALGTFKEGGTLYVTDGAGACWPNAWININGGWYLTNGSCACRTGWAYTGGAWYYLDGNANGKMVTGWKTIGGKKYYMNASGAMQTGWRFDGGYWYYLTSSGAAATGWQTIDSQTYWFDSNGVMAANCKKTIGGVEYEFTPSGAVKQGWVQENGGWYWYQSNGRKATGWLKDGSLWYYLSPSQDGRMVTGWQWIDGKWNAFNKTTGAWYTDDSLATDCWTYANRYSSSTNWFIVVDDARTKVIVYHWESGDWLPVHVYNCSTGSYSTPTPKGLFNVVYKEYSFGDDTHTCYYATCFAWGDYLFHSIIYRPNSFNVLDGTMNGHVSQGCIRMNIWEAQWIYDNIPLRTSVYIY